MTGNAEPIRKSPTDPVILSQEIDFPKERKNQQTFKKIAEKTASSKTSAW